jgi:hypothetical protein
MEGGKAMTRLVEEYFRRDLSDAEEEQLAKWLETSPEDTQRLIALMEEHYGRLGLQVPEPDWNQRPLPGFFPKPGFRLFRLWLLAVLALLAALGWVSYGRWFAKPKAAPVPAPVEAPKPQPPKAAAVPPAGAKTHEELSVVVDNPRPGLVTVRVLDSQNREIRLLYAGILPEGQRTFTWDGAGADGQVVGPGTYYLVVESGAQKMRKLVHVNPKESR